MSKIIDKIAYKIVTERAEFQNKKGFIQKYLLITDKVRYSFARKFIKGNKILNIACGNGHGSRILSKNQVEVIGIDNSEKAIQTAKRNYKGLRFEIGDAHNIKYKDNFFDSVVSIETIEHVKYPKKFISEIKRVIKKGGIFVISTPNKKVENKVCKNPFHISLMDKKELFTLLKKNFQILDIYYQSPMIKKPFFMPYLAYIFSSLFLSKKIIKHKKNRTGLCYLVICKKK